MHENHFIKVYLILHAFEVERDSLETKSKTISSYQTTKLLKIGFLRLNFEVELVIFATFNLIIEESTSKAWHCRTKRL